MIRITRTQSIFGGETAEVAFPYNPELVAIVRGIPGRRWDADSKVWVIYEWDIDGLVRQFLRAGQTVTVDGAIQEPPPPFEHRQAKADASPVLTFVSAMPERLRAPICRALAKVLHPDVGGDDELMKQLNLAREMYVT